MANEFKIKHGFISTGAGTIEGGLRITGAAYADNNSRIATRPWVTQFLSDNSYATATDISTAISNLVDSAPGTLDTLNELAAAIGDDADFAGTITTSIATKLPLAGGTMTGNITFTDDAEGIVWSRNTDGASIKFYNTADSDADSRLEFHTNDNNNEYFRWTHGPSGGALYEVMKLMPTSSGSSRLTVAGDIYAASNKVATEAHVSSNYLSKFHDITLTLTGDVSGSGTFNNMGDLSFDVQVADDSHNHDGRYYTETEMDTFLGGKLSISGDTLTGQVIFPSAATTKPVLPNGFISRNDNADTDGRHDIWGISERYYPSNSTAGDAWGIQWSGTPNDIVFVGGGEDKVTISLDEGNISTVGTLSASGYNNSNWDTAYDTTQSLGSAAFESANTFAAASHTHAAGDITSGTLASARLSGTYNISVSGSSASSNRLNRDDNRTIAPSEDSNGSMSFGFTSFQNNNTGGWADYLHLRSYTDSSGGNDNLVMFSKDSIEMRIWQQSYDSSEAYANYRDVAFKDELPNPAITSNGSTPSLSSGISAAEVRTLIGAGTSSSDTNYYLNGASFNTSNGVVTLNVAGATDQTVDLDGRYKVFSEELLPARPEQIAPPDSYPLGLYVTDSESSAPYSWAFDAGIVWGIHPANANNRHLQFISNYNGSELMMRMKNGTADEWRDWNHIATRNWVGSQNYLTSVPAEYLTQTEGDTRYLRLSGGTLTGNINANGSILGDGNLFLRSYNNDPKGIFFRDGFEYGDTNQYNLSITIHDDGDGAADGMNINAYDGVFFNVASGTTPNTKFRVLSGEVKAFVNLVSTGNVYASGGNSTEWNAAYDWGNHASAGYLTSYTETDTLDSVTNRGNTTTNSITVDNITANRGNFGSTGSNPQISIFTENESTSIADTFTDTTTDKSYIYFAAGTSSNDPGYIMHETSNATSPDERNEGVLHLVPSDDNNLTDYVSIHGTNDPDALRLTTDGKIRTSSSYRLTLSSGNSTVLVDDGLQVTGTVTAPTFSGSLSGNATTASTLATARNIALTGDVTGSANFNGGSNISITATVANDSHTHDGRYYTESESDARFVNVTGDNLTGDLSVSGASLSVTSTADGSEAFFVDGVNGRLFTITDSLSDSLFSVNTISGLPVIEAFSDNTVKLGPFSNPVTIDGAGVLAIGGETAATQSYVTTAINNLVGGAPGALNTLNELAAAINDDASFASSVTSSLALKAPLASPALTGTPTAPTQATSNNSTRIATTAFVKAQGYVTTDTNYYLNGITRSGNVLTFSVNGATNQTYTFGSAAWAATTAFDAAGTAASEAGAVNTRIEEEVLPLIQTPAITSNGSTPALNTGISAAEVRSLIGAQASGSYLTTTGKAADSNLLDGIDSSAFLRSNANDTFTGALTIDGYIKGNGQQLVLNAGESHSYATGQTGEYIYLNAEQGLEINSETGNWSGGWAARKTAYLRGDQLTLDGETLTKPNIQNFKTAYGWGNHASAGYLTAVPSAYLTQTEGDARYHRGGLPLTLGAKGDDVGGSKDYAVTGSGDSSLEAILANVALNFESAGDEPSTIYFRSGVNAPSDFAYISFLPNKAGSSEEAVLQLGVENDGAGSSDYIRLQGRVSTVVDYISSEASVIQDWVYVGTQKASIDISGNLQLDGTITASGYNKSNWDTAFGWGNHASAGYLTSIPSSYATDTEVATAASNAEGNAIAHADQRIDEEVLPSIPTNNNQLTNGAGYITAVPSTFSATSITIGSGVTLRESTDRADLLSINSGTSGWGGLQITNNNGDGIWSFMVDGSAAGIYDDQNGDWAVYCVENSYVELRHNGSGKLATKSSGVTVTGRMDATSDVGVGAELNLPNVHSQSKIQLHGDGGNAHCIGTSSFNNTYGPVSWTSGTLGHIFYGATNSPIATLGEGGSTAGRNTSTFYGNVRPGEDRVMTLGEEALRWQIVFCEILDSAGQHEKNLQNPAGEKPIGEYETGTVLVWKGGKNIPCTEYADHMRMGIAVKGVASPLIQGAEPVLVTGEVKEGDYLVTSRKEGHAEAISPELMRQQGLYDCVLGKALENGEGDSYLVKTWINI